MSRKSAFLEHLRDIKRSVDALMEDVETGGLPYGEYSGEAPEEPPAEEPTPPEPEEPPVEEPPAPDPDPTPPPATPKPPATNDDLVDGLRTGATPCGAKTPAAGMKVAGRDAMPAGIIVTQDRIIFDSFTGDFDDPDGWDFGNRQVQINSRFGAFNNWRSTNQIKRLIGKKGTTPGIWIKNGGGFDQMANVTSSDSNAVMVLKQEQKGVVGEITRCDFRGMQQDALKVCGSNLVHENLFADARYIGGTPHTDVLTVMSAEGDVIFRNNNVDWNYANVADQTGINNWFRIEVYGAYTGRYDDVIIEGNKLRQANGNSSAIQITEGDNPVWDGSVKIRNNRMEKVGGVHKIMHKPSHRISEWSNNTDFAGNDIPYSAT